ncbi:hypothetical protein CISIN_1g033111mg [Citrus sinensis]|uniref:Sulfiredoxin n=1 Tax=Citrus sinensis TaxID=2711 RepID=A0A067GCN8_CITSI|nr:hypothetical protein CISIN_1g033111mg [Citrus sinensis]KDO77359.1 hypothetical protein CISIN_1g033111mg [Citrus sinensis]
MANFVVQLPKTNSFNLKRFCVSASSNGNPPGSSESRGSGPVILELPLDKIRRPLMRTRANDQNKVKELMDSIQQIGLQVPVRTNHPPPPRAVNLIILVEIFSLAKYCLPMII